ncbi:membrane protein [Alphaproteobacteria bacterium]|nr:membrane protein [Alphaproteobacteria bacterium]GHS95971.1 membrane protein [Alphaproteobacteria bacterium]
MLVTILCVFLLLGASACFSAFETSFSMASKAKIHHFAKKGDKRFTWAERLRHDIGSVINAVLACNTALNAVATSLATGIALQFFGDRGVVYASVFMTFFILIFAEAFPKMLAIQNPEKIVAHSVYVMRCVLFLCRPITKFANFFSRTIFALLGKKNVVQSDEATLEELRGVIDLHKGFDDDSLQERAMLKSILDLRSVQVSEIMVHRKNVTMMNADDSLESLVDQLLDSPFSRIPLWQGTFDNIVGVVNVKRLLREVRSPSRDLNKNVDIRDIAQNPWFIPDSTDLLEQLQMFRQRKEHFALVVDEYGAWLGIVTLEDLLEEIVGEIDDEHDITVSGVRVQQDHSIVIDGSVTIRDLNREFDWELPDDIASTIAGLLINTVRMIPSVGQIFMLYGFRFTVLKRQRNQITLLKVVKCDEGRGEPENEGR